MLILLLKLMFYFYRMTNEEFFYSFAKTGSVGLVGGTHFIDRSIKKIQKKITPDKKPSLFSHAFIMSEKRIDDKWWIIESDLEFHTKQIKVGVQENRIDKYFDEKLYPNVVLLDFNLSAEQTKLILTEGLNLVNGRANYSMREIFGVLLSFSSEKRDKENVFARENSFICSAMVQHCYQRANLLFNKDVSLKHLTPQDIFTTTCQHSIEKLIREK